MGGLPLDDLEALQLTAEAMDTSEYQIFIEAYRAWYGHEPETRQVEHLFSQYMRGLQIPPLVRHFTHHYLEDHPEFLRARQARLWRWHQAEFLVFLFIVAMVVAALVLF